MPEPGLLPHVLRPGRIGTLRLPHRVIMGAMHLGIEARPDHGRALAAFYAERARGGAGLIVTGGAAVSRVGAGGPNYAILADQAHRARLGRVAGQVHAAGALIALQLFHAGRYASPGAFGLRPVAPSPVFSRISGCEPASMSEPVIRQTLADFGRGAAYARELGFDAVEIMASEGYLIDQFLSPVTNLREDDWGGDPGRRMRFGSEVLRHVRDAAGADFPVIYRFSGADLIEGGTSRADALAFARTLKDGGADALNVGVGWHESSVPTVQALVAPGAWVPVAAAVKAAVGDLPVITSNRINRLELAEQILAGSSLDFVSLARPFLADAALMASGGRRRPVNICLGCNQACIDRSLADAEVSCMVNPRAGRELEFPPATAGIPLRTAVIGGGPAGLQAARELAVIGHRVDLFEAASELGGQFRMACQVPGKEDYAETVRYFAAELGRLGVAVHRGRPVSGQDTALLRGYDAIIVATGVRPRPVTIPGADLPHVISYPDAFSGRALGQRIVIIGGGGIAIDLAHMTSHTGEHQAVTVLHRSKRAGQYIGKSTRWAVLQALRERGVEIVPDVTYQRIEPGGVRLTDATGADRLVPADTVVIAAGQECESATAELVRQSGAWCQVIGGARAVAGLDAVRAFTEGLTAARELSSGHKPEN
ncbi:MAG TPA: FAD-dependent oxidoreductase [Streptosporangiaceae bacterium]|jgi:2,4-dienoyl-CoA reductase (NADPH2)|nr:FAD-dependent oxidoreductase [Streptosporangiaceae bacterium]